MRRSQVVVPVLSSIGATPTISSNLCRKLLLVVWPRNIRISRLQGSPSSACHHSYSYGSTKPVPWRCYSSTASFCSSSGGTGSKAMEDDSDDDKVLISHDETTKIITITLNCPSTYNALTVEMGHTFRKKLLLLQNQLHDGSRKNANVCILRGAGKAFSSGGKLEWLHDRKNVPTHSNADIMFDFYKSYLTSLRSLQLPTIAAIHGPAMGAGACLALACDLRVMTQTTNIGFNFVSLGIHAGMGASHFLPRTIGRTASNHILLTGQILSGTKAYELGLINRLVDTPSLALTEATALAEEIAHQNPLAIRRYVKKIRTVDYSFLFFSLAVSKRQPIIYCHSPLYY
jgi:enoyl-CoA hydratase/carnithine racemase